MNEMQAYALCFPKARAEGDVESYAHRDYPWTVILTVNK